MKGILAAMDDVEDGRGKTLAIAFATAYLETGRRMIPAREGFAKTDKVAIKAVVRLARRFGAGNLAHRTPLCMRRPYYGSYVLHGFAPRMLSS